MKSLPFIGVVWLIVALFLNTVHAEGYINPYVTPDYSNPVYGQVTPSNSFGTFGQYQPPVQSRSNDVLEQHLRKAQEEYARGQMYNNSAAATRRGYLQNCALITGNPAAQRYCYMGAP